jgi:putative ABC transport system substrate-binding protein
MLSRRQLLSTLSAGLLAAPFAAEAQSAARTPRIAVLGLTPISPALRESLGEGLADFRYVEGRNVVIEYRDADAKPERLAQLAVDLVGLNVDVIFARGAGALSAARQATDRISIVAVDLETDPVAMGFVRSLAQPGGNITGVFLDLPELSGKQLQFLQEIVRPLARVAVLGDPVLNAPQFRAAEVAARALTIQTQRLDLRGSKDIVPALEEAKKGRANAVLLLSSPLVFYHRMELGELTAKHRLPAVSMFAEFAQAGGLMAYGPSLREAFRLAGARVGQILQGAKPGELPVERPTKFETVINRKTAKALGLTIPPSVLLQATQTIE